MAREYKLTLFDRHGPDALSIVRSVAYGAMVFGLCIPLFWMAAYKVDMPVGKGIVFVLGWSTIAGLGAGAVGYLMGHGTGAAWKHLMMAGSSTPYKEQYSYQQSLVMQGRVDDALASFEAVIEEKPTDAAPRLRAAELYASNKKNPARAAELFREVQRLPAVASGDDIYASNRLVDLYHGPLADPGRALVELRRLIDRYPGSAAASHARDALVKLKHELHSGDD